MGEVLIIVSNDFGVIVTEEVFNKVVNDKDILKVKENFDKAKKKYLESKTSRAKENNKTIFFRTTRELRELYMYKYNLPKELRVRIDFLNVLCSLRHSDFTLDVSIPLVGVTNKNPERTYKLEYNTFKQV